MMIDRLAIRPDDRILLLSIPETEFVLELSARLETGLVVGLGGREEVYEARTKTRDRANVMFHPGPPEQIPFQDGFFSKVIDLKCLWEDTARVAHETARVLAPAGRAFLAIEDVGVFVEAGLKEGEIVERLRVLGKSEAPPEEQSPGELPLVG